MIRLLIVDDSPSVRRVLTGALESEADITVVGAAANAQEAQQLIAETNPDVLTLDVAMPGMSGLDFLQWLTAHHPLPAIVLSAVTPTDSRLALRALDLGAAEVICKPGVGRTFEVVLQELVRVVREAARSRLRNSRGWATAGQSAISVSRGSLRRHVVAVGASTGGTRALEALMLALPEWCPGMVVVQHMPPGFTAPFAQRLNQLSAMTVREAREGDVLHEGLALVAPGGSHLVLTRQGANYVARLNQGPKEHHQRPSADVLFRSVAECAGGDAVGVLLTGMGSDGALGLKAMRAAHAHTIAEDESTCVVYGMPAAAVHAGAVMEVQPLPAIPQAILAAAARPAPPAAVAAHVR